MQCLTRCYATGFTQLLGTFSLQRLAFGVWRLAFGEDTVVDAQVNQKSETLLPVAVSY
jgi:hypothetical protein